MEKQGKLLIIGFGPGALEQITGRALAAIEESEAVIGYNTYVELIKPLLTHQEIVGTGMTEEVSRAQEAVRRAEAGQTIAVISSGDAGVYGMAGLVYEVLMEHGWNRESGVAVEVIPGISAIQSCASLLGAPVMHDSCTISLSDHLTPWDSIAARVEAAAAADFVIAFYNPRSGRRTQQIEEARSILLRYREPSTPVGIVKNAYRDRQKIIVTTLEEMPMEEIGMLSTVIVGNSATTVYDGLMVTPRGYERKYDLGAQTQALKPHERLRPAAEPWSLAAGRRTGGVGSISKKTILLVGHGSRVEAGNEELRGFTARLAARRPGLNIETCFIELSAPSIAEGIERCVAGGAAEIYVVPIILFAAGHSKLDIPMAIDRAKMKYPEVQFAYGRPVGVQERAADIVLDRINEAVPAGPENTLRSAPVPAEDTVVLMMGRGGSDPDANSDFYKLSRLLWERTAYKSVESCFIAITKPSLDEGLERCLALGARKIIVQPYLLFTGVLMQQFTERVTAFAAAHPGIEVELGSYIGNHPLLEDMLTDRMDEVLNGQSFANCDNCRYRDEAAEHHHHHHHHGHGEAGHDHHHHGEGGHSHHGHSHGHHHGHHHDHESAAQITDNLEHAGTAAAETAAAGSPKEL
ncbi:precorrin-3B C(17)-methyltransferase [Paenibacillus sp. FSL R7-0273]|uniref:precorrin-3B C(17)-methyltransferase n=1 Tax=Paenibacillus sp. FSL R7-0273 TaxID=1536772 RepID=UPI0009E0608A|nr:precorrin-3B C(17)-methyltransferase [Paenibacillus sp. FSL R7-0273]